MEFPTLPLKNLDDRHSGLTKTIAECFCEAAFVCLDRNHTPPQNFILTGDDFEKEAMVDWISPDDRCKRAWANKDDATRDGAYSNSRFNLYMVLIQLPSQYVEEIVRC